MGLMNACMGLMTSGSAGCEESNVKLQEHMQKSVPLASDMTFDRDEACT